MPEVGDIARRTRLVTARDIELFTEMTAEVEVREARKDKPITTVRTTITTQTGTVVLDGTAVIYTEPLL